MFYPAAKAEAGLISDIIKFFSKSGLEDAQRHVPVVPADAAAISFPLLGSNIPPLATGGPESVAGLPSLPVTQDNALIALRNPAGTVPNAQPDQISIYKVQAGDTPGEIADTFGVSLSTLLWANNIRNPNLIKVGDELVILPVSGVQYKVEKGDTISSIAQKFKGDTSDILSFNGLAFDENLEVGSIIIIPDGEMPTPPAPTSRGSVRYNNSQPEFKGYYLRPILGGRKSRGIHGFNGIDLATLCGEPVLASAGGNVILARSTGWNGGYGRYLAIAHSNGTQTLYAHLDRALVGPGQNVSRGFVVGLVGSTGNSTGCHVHFEVRGARNPF